MLFLSMVSIAQISIEGEPKTFSNKNIGVLLTATLEIEEPDLTKEIEYNNNPDNFYKVRKFGVIIPVNVDFFDKADKIELKEGSLWLLKIRSNNAKALNIYSNNFYIPKGGELYIYNSDHSQLIGAFTSINNHESKSFATEMVVGEEIIIEYFQPKEITQRAEIQLSDIGYAYRDFGYDITKFSDEFGASGSCNVNVNCPEGNNYRNAQRGVVRILMRMGDGSSGWCTGSLVNNTSRDLTPYVLSAAHCVEDMVSSYYYNYFVFYFNYESSGCTTGNIEPTPNTMTGASFKAAGTASDFLLLQLNQNVPTTYNAYWNAWSISTSASTSGVSIHHPSGDIKKISTYNTALQTANLGYGSTHWLAKWVQTQTNYGITEKGSSGCPLFNAQSQIVGTLTGGTSACNATIGNRVDYYGKFSYSWASNGTTDNKMLKPWLDPLNLGVTTFRGDDYTTLSNLLVESQSQSYSLIYPNPTNENLNISLSKLESPTQLELYDELGRMLMKDIIPANTSTHSLNIKGFKSGNYILKFVSQDKAWTNKLIVQ